MFRCDPLPFSDRRPDLLLTDCQPLSLGLFRSDYMVHWDTSDEASVPHIKQVEFNTIASSFGGLSSQTSLLHKYVRLRCLPLVRHFPDSYGGRFLAATEYPALQGSSKH